MRRQLSTVFTAITEFLRVIGTSLGGAMPAMRSADGTFGTQRAKSRTLAQQRAADYPHD